MKIQISLILLLIFSACATKKTNAVYYNYKTQCMGVELDGSQTLKAWGNGKDKNDAVEQALKNAVNDVLFNGITEGKQECQMKPLIPEANAREKHEDYFNKFFANGGNYKSFISFQDERKNSGEEKIGAQSVTFSVTVRVQRPELKQRLIADGIIK